MTEFHLFLPQLRLTMETIVERAQAAEAAGFSGIAFMDHLAPPAAEGYPMFDALATAAWVASKTSRLQVGHLVLCDSFRHPAVLAREVASLDQDRILRALLGLLTATLRTNAYRCDAEGNWRTALAFKLDPRLVPDA